VRLDVARARRRTTARSYRDVPSGAGPDREQEPSRDPSGDRPSRSPHAPRGHRDRHELQRSGAHSPGPFTSRQDGTMWPRNDTDTSPPAASFSRSPSSTTQRMLSRQARPRTVRSGRRVLRRRDVWVGQVTVWWRDDPADGAFPDRVVRDRGRPHSDRLRLVEPYARGQHSTTLVRPFASSRRRPRPLWPLMCRAGWLRFSHDFEVDRESSGGGAASG
jgi:hypothetical protein